MDAIRDYGPWVLSILALAQYWIGSWFRRSRAPAALEMYESGSIEVGFDSNGPLIALAGVLRPGHSETFVRAIELTVLSDKDKAKREFRWIAFKPNFLLPLAGAKAWEMPHPFLVRPGETSRYNIVFHDSEGGREVKRILQGYQHQWRDAERRILEWRQRRGPGGPASLDGKGDAHDDLVAEFKRQESTLTAYTDLDRACWWEQGSYSLAVKVLSEGGPAMTKEFRFTLGKMDSKLLKSNCVNLLDEPIAATMGRGLAPCIVAQADYAGPAARA